MTKVFIDIGAYKGLKVDELIARQTDSDYVVHCFEPNPQLSQELRQKYHNNSNVVVHEKAIGSQNETVDFYISNFAPCSSLKPFVAGGEAHQYWSSIIGEYQQDLKTLETSQVIKVETIRLDTFIEKESINFIESIKIDAQGSDLDVVKSWEKKYK